MFLTLILLTKIVNVNGSQTILLCFYFCTIYQAIFLVCLMFLQLGPHRAHQRGRTRVCALRRLTSLTRAPGDLTVPLVPFIVFSPLALSRCVLRGRQHYELPVTTDKCVHVVYYRRRRGLRRRGRLGRRPGIFE